MRSFVAFEDLWSMPIDVPYSLLVRDGDMAWSCGQVALDADTAVIGADDLAIQSGTICDYIDEVLARGDLRASSVQRLLLYYVDQGPDERDRMLGIFGERFGDAVLLDPIPVPHFYYDGVLLEVDAFCTLGNSRFVTRSRSEAALEMIDGGEVVWASLETADPSLEAASHMLDEALHELGMSRRSILSEHWFVPTHLVPETRTCLGESNHEVDGGALVEIGRSTDKISGVLQLARGSPGPGGSNLQDLDDLRILTRTRGTFTWVHARSLNETLTLVDQTKQIMSGIEQVFGRLGLSFADVVKSTTHYVGSDSPEELHENMRVRNGYYAKPGPASTGLPVFGFSDQASRIVVDVTAVSNAAQL